MRVGTPAVTTRGLKESHMLQIVDLVDKVIMNYENEEALEAVAQKVSDMMAEFPIFAS